MRRSPGLRGSARRSSFISGASKCKPGTKRNAVVRVRKIKSLAFHLPVSGQLSIGEELTDGQELVENSGSFGGGRKRDRTSDLGLVRAALRDAGIDHIPHRGAPEVVPMHPRNAGRLARGRPCLPEVPAAPAQA